MSTERNAEWGNLLKSNSNGTYYGLSLDHVNRNTQGYVDFEKMIGIDGVVVVNIITNPEEAARSGKKKLQTRISHNDGSSPISRFRIHFEPQCRWDMEIHQPPNE
jgi:Sortilin, neurotensin receptor 3,